MDTPLPSVKKPDIMMFLPLLTIWIAGVWLLGKEGSPAAVNIGLTVWYCVLTLVYLELHVMGMSGRACIWLALLSLLWGVRAGRLSVLTLVLLLLLLFSLKKERPDLFRKAAFAGMMIAVPACLWELARFTISLCFLAAVLHEVFHKIAGIREERLRALYETELLTELNRVKNQSYAELSHEMKTPLTVITVNAQLAAMTLESGELDEETITDIKIISKEASRLTQMVTSLATLGQLQGSGVGHRLLSLDALVKTTARTCQALAMRYGNTLTVDAEPNLPQMLGNADHLAQVMINLISNANRHTRNGSIAISVKTRADWLEVSVTDNGEGIASELLPHVFDRFCRGDQGDTGLGLFICKKIMDEHGGKIGIESETGTGTRVWFRLPAIKDETEKKI